MYYINFGHFNIHKKIHICIQFYNLRHIWTHRENFSFEKHILVLFTLRLYCLFVPLLSTFYHFGSFIARLFTPRGKVRILNITITWKWSAYSKKQKYFCLQKYWIELSRAIDMQLYLAIIYDNRFFLPYFIYIYISYIYSHDIHISYIIIIYDLCNVNNLIKRMCSPCFLCNIQNIWQLWCIFEQVNRDSRQNSSLFCFYTTYWSHKYFPINVFYSNLIQKKLMM